MTHPNHQRIIDALRKNPEPLIDWAAKSLIALGAKSEWDMDDNFSTTESLVRLTYDYGLPGAGDQDDAALRFYGSAAIALGYPADLEDMDEETSTCRHCGRDIVKDPEEGWIDRNAGYDDEDGDGIWRTTCDAHDTFTAEHEPEEEQ